MIDNLPSSLTNLTLGLYFNQMIDNLPSSLTHLTLGSYFYHIIKKIPKNIKKIYVVDGTNKKYHFVSKCMILLVAFYIINLCLLYKNF